MTTIDKSTRTDPVEILRNLIQCPSVTPEDGGALSMLESRLAPSGFEVHRPVFSEPGTPDIENLFASIGKGQPHLVFAGHTDVVPPGDRSSWTHDPFAGAIENGLIYGRGAADMKGGIACFIAAVTDFLRDNGREFDGRISFLITGDEEGPAINGTVKLLAWAAERGERFDACLLGEPTNPGVMGDMAKIGRRGSLTGELTVFGTQGHVAYPDLADNPIRGLIGLLRALTDEPLDKGTDRFQPSNLEPTTVDVGNPATNVIPETARAAFNIRFNDLWSAETLSAELHRRLDQAAGNDIRYALDIQPSNSQAFVTDGGPLIDILVAVVSDVTGREPELSTGGGTSDARFIKDYCPVVEFGLVGKTMHQVDEHVEIADLETLTSIYRSFLDRYFVGEAAA